MGFELPNSSPIKGNDDSFEDEVASTPLVVNARLMVTESSMEVLEQANVDLDKSKKMLMRIIASLVVGKVDWTTKIIYQPWGH